LGSTTTKVHLYTVFEYTIFPRFEAPINTPVTNLRKND